ncbi:MAG: zinc ribbon domain-containing protein [Candidatus Bathyarchaeota archaeon]|nr:zinc ribbon domain-containing protein [Candidatus Bathyarchaeota archaeon]
MDNLPFCSNCGTPVEITQKFCPNCGQRLGPAPAPPQQPAQPVAPTTLQQGYVPVSPSTPVAPGAVYGERIISIVPNLKKPKSFGRWDTYNLIVTDKRCVFAILTADMLNKSIQEANEQGKAQGKGVMDRWGDQMSATMGYWRRYESMDSWD